MPRYFFHSEDGQSRLDEEGIELATDTEAKVEAASLMGAMLRDQAANFWDQHALKLIITNEAGLILFVLDLSGVEAPAIRRKA